MRIAKAQGIRLSPLVAAALAMALLTPPGERAVMRGAHGAAALGGRLADTVRLEIEPAVFIGGLVVSRSRHVIAGAVMGCAAGAGVGAGAAAVAGLATGGLGWAAIAPAAGIGCAIGASGGVAVGYPLDNWALSLD